MVLTPLIPLAAVVFFYQNYSKTESLETHANLGRIVSSSMAQHIDNLGWRTSFAQNLDKKITSTQGTQILRDALSANPDFLMLAVLDEKGHQLYSAGPKPILNALGTIDLSQEDSFAAVKKAGRLNVSSFDIKLGLPIAEILLPLKNGKTLFGVVSFFNIWLRMEEQKIGETGHIYLVHESGQVFNFDKGEAPFAAAKMERIIKEGSVYIKSLKGAEGITWAGAIVPSPVDEAYIAVLQNKKEAYKDVNLVSLILLFFFLAIATLAYFAALQFAGKISEPIANMIAAAKRISAGNYSEPVPLDMEWQEFDELIKAFNRMMEDIEKYQELKVKQQIAEIKDFVFNSVAHDLRAPLLGLQGYTELLANENISVEDRRTYVATMSIAVRELLTLLEDVLDISKLEAGMLHPKKEKFDFKEMLDGVLASITPLADAKKLDIKKDLHTKTMFYGDKKLISRVMLNLITNAIKFTEAGGVTITYNADKDRFYVSVADTGIGMQEIDRDIVFDKYRQLDERVKGYGLGLTISRQIVHAHGGEIDIKSHPGQGTTISFYTKREKK